MELDHSVLDASSLNQDLFSTPKQKFRLCQLPVKCWMRRLACFPYHQHVGDQVTCQEAGEIVIHSRHVMQSSSSQHQAHSGVWLSW